MWKENNNGSDHLIELYAHILPIATSITQHDVHYHSAAAFFFFFGASSSALSSFLDAGDGAGASSVDFLLFLGATSAA
jgi:hypothetical protein